ncbi:hypothetical protein Cni_G00809 [Canna indica]|uniref:DUF761 domain-containing protein n=1 Tax=Canna indica TaxID=4628 RepID=A0AAQ3JLM2_9LILI|nr:hypothetical protein Cni_G00809 [Canna indica]
MASKKRIPVLSRLRSAIQKVKFLLSFDATKWIVSSLKKSPSDTRRLSFKTPPSLLDCSDDYYECGSSFTISRTTSLSYSPASSGTAPSLEESEMSRSVSDVSSPGEDVNQRAENFIEKFYQQLKMERQISLELRYLREKSLERAVSVSD